VNRRTKIIATIGPASDSEENLRHLIEAGMDVARISLAHDNLDITLERYNRVRKMAAEFDHEVGIMVDLPGPKVRAGSFPDEGVVMVVGDRIRLVPGFKASTHEVVEVGYERLLSDIEPGDRLAFGDGVVDMEILDYDNDGLIAEITHGGKVQGRPGVHIPSDRLRIPSPTREDLRMLDAFVEADVDMVAVSMVRSAHDVRMVGTEPHPRGPLVVAKIETRAAVENLTGILDAAGAVMVARGDLGNECPIEDLPHLQKHIIRECIAHGRPAITATQMLESMLHSATPTRAEATDVANAIFDGTSAVMLSGETAIGHDPANAVATMASIAERADTEFDYQRWAMNLADLRIEEPSNFDTDITDTMTMATWRAATELDASAIIAITRSGFTVRAIARFRPQAQILGFSSDPRTIRQLTLSWGSTPILMPSAGNTSNKDMVDSAVAEARTRGLVRRGDIVAVLAGSHGQSPATDVLRVVRVP